MAPVKRVVVVGASAAGSAAVEAIRRFDRSCRLTLISDEPVPLYSRCLLSEYLTGKVGLDRLTFQPGGWPAGLDVEVVRDRAVEVDPSSGEVRTAEGRRFGYDGLLLATGARGIRPSIPGIDSRGVYVPYRLDQVNASLAGLEHAGDVAVLGAGKVGIKAAEAAAKSGRRVTLVEQAPQPLPGVVDEVGGRLVRRILERHGVRVRTGVTLMEIEARDGTVSGLVLSGGDRIACQTLLVAAGVQPRVELACQAGAEVADGIVVDEWMQTSLEGVYAAGDVAEAPVRLGSARAVLANWLNAVHGGRVAGRNLSGRPATYPGGVRTNSFSLWDVPVVSVGEVTGSGLSSLDEHVGRYRKLVIRGRQLVGVMQIGGELREIGVLSTLVKSGQSVDQPRAILADGFAVFEMQWPRLALAGEGA